MLFQIRKRIHKWLARWSKYPSFLNLQWWSEHVWNVKIQFLLWIFFTVILVLSLMGYTFYEVKFSRFSKEFIRLQTFGPQHLVYPVSEESSDLNLNSMLHYHIETRAPYVHLISDVPVTIFLETPEGETIWQRADQTDSDGCLDVEVPSFPEHMGNLRLKIVATHNGQESVFCGNIRTSFAVEPEVFTWNWSEIPFHETTFDSMDWNGNEPSGGLTLNRRVIPARRSIRVRVKSTSEQSPYFLGVWKDNTLITCRPVVTGTSEKSVKLSIPPEVTGLLKIALLDYGTRPPRVLREEYCYRMPATSVSHEGSESDFLARLDEFVGRTQTALFRQSEHDVDFLSMEVNIPEESAPIAFTPEEGEGQLSEKHRLQQNRWTALEYLLASNAPAQTREELGRLEFLICSVVETPELMKEAEALMLVERALEAQSCHENMVSQSSLSHRFRSVEFPLVYDNLKELHQTRTDELSQFRHTLRKGLSAFASQLTCLSVCLVFFLLMAALLAIPVGRRVWLLAGIVIVLAIWLSFDLSKNSDVLSSTQSVPFEIFEGKRP